MTVQAMTISSRTPEGLPAECSVCDSEVRMEPSLWFGDATCPKCGQLLWLIRFNHGPVAFQPSEKARQRSVREVLCAVLGVDDSNLDDQWQSKVSLATDSLDVTELVMDLEEEMER